MPPSYGTLTLMGSGEMTSSMVNVHRYILDRIEERPVQAVFLDTPAGFQLNADILSAKASEYFSLHFNVRMEPISFKSASQAKPLQTADAAFRIEKADLIFAGPGSPTYAIDNWQGNRIGQAIHSRLYSGGNLVFASAASLTVGHYSIPVYEIYKVGQMPFWAFGLDLLSKKGIDLAVIPHWNNTEGGNHDTRYCYMGEPRLKELESMLPDSAVILGIEEHTACIIDLKEEKCMVMGVGQVAIRYDGRERYFPNGTSFDLQELRPEKTGIKKTAKKMPHEIPDIPLLTRVDELQREFLTAIREDDHVIRAAQVLIKLAEASHLARDAGSGAKDLIPAQDMLTEMLKVLAGRLKEITEGTQTLTNSLVEMLINIRADLRGDRQWRLADTIRSGLASLGVIVEDNLDGTHWRKV
ncbi:MAG: hypothetical protein SWO11_15820 [Thermodesulfobacteriota bacterium]|nr:hypothetical protein [Thermodesulfobacteriota bacterium]